MLQTTDIIDIFKSPTNKKREVQWNPLMFPVGSSHSLDKSLMIWPIAAYCFFFFFFYFNFYVKPWDRETFSSGHSQERDKRPLKVVHSIEVLLQVNLLTILSTQFFVRPIL